MRRINPQEKVKEKIKPIMRTLQIKIANRASVFMKICKYTEERPCVILETYQDYQHKTMFTQECL